MHLCELVVYIEAASHVFRQNLRSQSDIKNG